MTQLVSDDSLLIIKTLITFIADQWSLEAIANE